MDSPEAAISADVPESSKRQAAIAIDQLVVRFSVYTEHRLRARELLVRGFRSREMTSVHAVSGVSLRIDVGEAVGIVGPNGSGKSTLLLSIAGLQSPTSGSVLVRSQPQLLGVTPALVPNLTGRRNIELGALAIGWRYAEVKERMDDVIAYAELERAIDRPLKTYSSGMRARLAFSIATLRTPDIMLIDEALAVGDKSFRKKSLARVRKIQEEAGTVVMVTHNLNEIRATCTRALWMADGEIVADGPTEEVLAAYEASSDD